MQPPDSLRHHHERVEAALESHMRRLGAHDRLGAEPAPASLVEAMAYSLLAGGKRVRPVLLLAVRDLFDVEAGASVGATGDAADADAMRAACALELVHTYSLVHDDLPAMDDDDLRRGRPTSHRRFGEASALLAGDALLTEAFALLAGISDPALARRLTGELAEAAGARGMVGGQVLDIEAAGQTLAQPELEHMHRLKTGRLLRAAVRCGALLGGADEGALATLTRMAEALGLLFQVTDDILDVTGDVRALGKTPGKDAAVGKPTFPDLLGLDGARAHAAGLADQARAALSSFGAAAEPLRELVRFVHERLC